MRCLFAHVYVHDNIVGLRALLSIHVDGHDNIVELRALSIHTCGWVHQQLEALISLSSARKVMTAMQRAALHTSTVAHSVLQRGCLGETSKRKPE